MTSADNGFLSATADEWRDICAALWDKPVSRFVLLCWANQQSVSAGEINAAAGRWSRDIHASSPAQFEIGTITRVYRRVPRERRRLGDEAFGYYTWNEAQASWPIGHSTWEPLRAAVRDFAEPAGG